MPRPSEKSDRPEFPDTRWTLISRVRHGSDEEAKLAMEDLCRDYWYPLYAFARRAGFGVHDAEDLTQQFFQNLVTSEGIQEARREKGRLRTFMLAMLKRVISKVRRHESAEKRGGGREATVSFDDMSAEERYSREPTGDQNPDVIFDRAWAEKVLETASEKLRAEYTKTDSLDTFQHICEFLPLGENETPYPEAAKKLNLREAALRLQIHRMRRRYGRLVEVEIAQTVSHPDEVKAELTYLMAAVAR